MCLHLLSAGITGRYHHDVLVAFSVAVRKYPEESDLRQEGSIWGHSLKVQIMLASEPKGQELEAAGPCGFPARKKITRLLVLS